MQFVYARILTNLHCTTTSKLQVKMGRRKAKGSEIEKSAPAQMDGKFQTLSFAFFFSSARPIQSTGACLPRYSSS
jgi:hypothetical protein